MERGGGLPAYLRLAGAKAAARSAHRSAVAHFEQALGALVNLPETTESLELAVDLRFQLRNSLFPLGEISQMLEHLHEAQARAERLGDPRRLAQVYAFLTNAYMAVGDHDRAVRSGQRALELGTEVGDFTLEVLANYRLGQVHYTLGRNRQALESSGRQSLG